MTQPTNLTDLAREIAALTRSGRDYAAAGGDDAARALAARFEAFAEAAPNLDPETHRNYLVRLARCLDVRCAGDLDAARLALGLPR